MADERVEDFIERFSSGSSCPVLTTKAYPALGSWKMLQGIEDGHSFHDRRNRFGGKNVDRVVPPSDKVLQALQVPVPKFAPADWN